jgi:protein-S-isoprenylcysteine O-methyltransferase Ste14
MNGADLHGPGIRVPPPLIFLVLGVLGWAIEQWLDRLPVAAPGPFVLTVSIALLAIGLALIAAALLRFRQLGTRPEPWKPASVLTVDGIYRFTRNPMYLGMTLLGIAAGTYFRSPGALAGVVAACLVVDRWVIPREESYLRARFGAAYEDYCQRVGRWL